MRFIEYPTFTRQIEELLTLDEYKEFQRELAAEPTRGKVIPGLGGLRKVRVGFGDTGKRGGARVIYLLPRPDIAYLFYAYSKGDIEDMTAEQKRRLRKAVEDIKRELG